jgi:PRC-barrel domain
MSAPVEDVTELPGKTVRDQDEESIGEIKEIYAIGGNGHPTWVTVEAQPEDGEARTVFIPLARLKYEFDELCVPYTREHILSSPEVEAADKLSEDDEHALRGFYSIGVGDGELRTDNNSYATLVPDEDDDGASERVRDVDALETPSADKRTDETRERLQEAQSSTIRKVTAEDVLDEDDMREKREAAGRTASERQR